MTSPVQSGIGKVTKRLVISVLGAALIYWSLKVHRDWVWAYFESLILTANPSAELSNVATASISAITTAFITSSTAIGFIVAFFITGNVAAITSMFKWSNTAQAVGESVAQSINERITEERIKVIHAPKASHFDDEEIP